MSATVIALINKKGGVGKTSSTHHLGGTLAHSGRRVLLIDNDPQASLTTGLYGHAATEAIPATATVAALYDNSVEPIPEAVIRSSGFENLDLIPGSEALTTYNMLPPERWGEGQGGLRAFLTECRGAYDLVFIDCAPNLHLCSFAALIAADAVIVPLQPEVYGAYGLAPIQDAIAAVQAGPNPDLSLLGYLLTMYDKRLAIHQTYEQNLRGSYGSAVFTNPFPLAKDFKEAVALGKPVVHYKPKGQAAKAAQAVADELLARVKELKAGQGRAAA